MSKRSASVNIHTFKTALGPKKSEYSKDKWVKIKQQCIEQSQKFKKWGEDQKWWLFHSSHYDWWAFPIDQDSGSYGSAFKVLPEHINLLKKDEKFLSALKTNALLVCCSWGWNLQTGSLMQANESQKWQRWPIRLSKMCRSLEIFGEEDKKIHQLFENGIKYGMHLLEKGEKFYFGGNDLAPYFRQKDQQIKKQKLKNGNEGMKVQKKNKQKQYMDKNQKQAQKNRQSKL